MTFKSSWDNIAANGVLNPITADLDLNDFRLIINPDGSWFGDNGFDGILVEGADADATVDLPHGISLQAGDVLATSTTAGATSGSSISLLAGDFAHATRSGSGGSITIRSGSAVSTSGTANGADMYLETGSGGDKGGDLVLRPGYDSGDEDNNGHVKIDHRSGAGIAPQLWFKESPNAGDDAVKFKAPDDLSDTSTLYTLPATFPSLNGNTSADGNALSSNESGVMKWDAVTHDSATLQTTDNTIQDLRTFLIPSGSTVVLEFTVAAFDSTNSEGGSVRNGSASAQNIGGTSTLIASTVTTDGLSTSTAVVSVDVDDTLDVLRVRVTGGPATTTIDWKLSARILTQ